MISEIYIKNYILMPEKRLKLKPGLTVITGETGAGKSILVGSISLVFAGASQGVEAFDPSQPIYLELTFEPPHNAELSRFLVQQDLPADEELILAREISVKGKSSYYLGGRKISAGLMKELKELLLDFHSQRDQQKLLSPAYQLEILDHFAENQERVKDFAAFYHRVKKGKEELLELKKLQTEQAQKLELYRYQYSELEKAALLPDEDRLLEQEFELLSHSKEIVELIGNMQAGLFQAENSVLDQIGSFQASLEHYRPLNEQLGTAADALFEAREALLGAEQSTSILADTLSFDPGRFSQIAERLDIINGLLHKHKVQSVAMLLELFEKRQQELSAADDLTERIQKLSESLETQLSSLFTKADELSEIRQTAAARLSRQLEEKIRKLAMKESCLQISIDKKSTPEKVLVSKLELLSENGADQIEMLFSANVGGNLRPLSQVASGGELSRILLGIKQVLAEKISSRLLILDEIDAGVGGKTAELMAAAIATIARSHPVLCITHLAQIAAFADTHIAVEKISDERTSVDLKVLQPDARVRELARMLSGNVTQHALKHAEELITKQNRNEDLHVQSK